LGLLIAHCHDHRFDLDTLLDAMAETGFQLIASNEILRSFTWIVATKPAST